MEPSGHRCPPVPAAPVNRFELGQLPLPQGSDQLAALLVLNAAFNAVLTKLLRTLLALALSTGFTMELVLDIMANLVDERHPGLAGRLLDVGGKGLALADPLLVRS